MSSGEPSKPASENGKRVAMVLFILVGISLIWHRVHVKVPPDRPYDQWRVYVYGDHCPEVCNLMYMSSGDTVGFLEAAGTPGRCIVWTDNTGAVRGARCRELTERRRRKP